MARTTKKKAPEAHKIDCVEVFAALRDLEKTKGIPVDYMLEKVEAALVSAFKKEYGMSPKEYRDISTPT